MKELQNWSMARKFWYAVWVLVCIAGNCLLFVEIESPRTGFTWVLRLTISLLAGLIGIVLVLEQDKYRPYVFFVSPLVAIYFFLEAAIPKFNSWLNSLEDRESIEWPKVFESIGIGAFWVLCSFAGAGVGNMIGGLIVPPEPIVNDIRNQTSTSTLDLDSIIQNKNINTINYEESSDFIDPI